MKDITFGQLFDSVGITAEQIKPLKLKVGELCKTKTGSERVIYLATLRSLERPNVKVIIFKEFVDHSGKLRYSVTNGYHNKPIETNQVKLIEYFNRSIERLHSKT